MSIAPHRYEKRRGRAIATCERDGCGVQRKYENRRGRRTAVVVYRTKAGGSWTERRPPCVRVQPADALPFRMPVGHRATVTAALAAMPVPAEARIVHVATAVIFGVGVAGHPHGAKGTCLYTQRRDDVMRPGMWEHPGGKLEAGETLVEAVKREALEELGVVIEVDGLLGTICMDLVTQVIVLTAFACHIRPGEPTPQPLIAKALRWVEPQHAVEWLACSPGTYPIHRALIAWLEASR